MRIEHNSHNSFCRTPFGAAVCGCTVTLRLMLGDSAWPESVVIQYEDSRGKHEKLMHYHSTMLGAYVYEAQITMPNEPCVLFYSFKLNFDNSSVYYGNNAQCLGGIGEQYENNPIPYQITVYTKDYKTPEWLKNGVMYQIFVDRFAKSDKFDNSSLRSDIIYRNWGEMPYYLPEQFGGEYLANDFFGGSLAGVIEKLDYLADLGVTILYLNPIFEAYSNHKYDTADYEKIDKMFGDEKIFATLCKEAKKRNMKIILDGVFNHTGSDSKYFNKNNTYQSVGAYQGSSSPYYDWFCFKSFPDDYESWWGIKTLPAVNENSQSYRKYILTDKNSIIKRWLRLGASGWRLDVADELPGDFIEQLRYEAKSVDSDCAIIGEVWEDASNKISYGTLRSYLCGKQLDSVMNYPLRNAMIDYVLCKIDAKTFNAKIQSLRENYPREAFMATMNFLSSHDTERIFTKMSGMPDSLSRTEQANYTLDKNQYALAYKRTCLIFSFLMCMPGMPSIFYGDEIGMQGARDPFCRACFDFNKTTSPICDHFKSIIKMRKDSHALSAGDFESVYGDGQVCAFVRIADDDFKLIIINTDENSSWNAPLELGRFFAYRLTRDNEQYESQNGRFILNVEPMSIKIYDVERFCKGEKA